MPRLFAVLLGFVLLSGFSEQDALSRFAGGWQMADRLHGTNGALQLDSNARTLKVVQGIVIEGRIDKIDVVGSSAIMRVGGNVVVLYSGPDMNTIGVQVGEQNAVLTYVRVP